jgi:hypothetical protein
VYILLYCAAAASTVHGVHAQAHSVNATVLTIMFVTFVVTEIIRDRKAYISLQTTIAATTL